MGGRLGCTPASSHLHSPSMNADVITELNKQIDHLAPIHEVMEDLQMSPKGAPPPPATPPPHTARAALTPLLPHATCRTSTPAGPAQSCRIPESEGLLRAQAPLHESSSARRPPSPCTTSWCPDRPPTP